MYSVDKKLPPSSTVHYIYARQSLIYPLRRAEASARLAGASRVGHTGMHGLQWTEWSKGGQ
jgi:hypothetical protein